MSFKKMDTNLPFTGSTLSNTLTLNRASERRQTINAVVDRSRLNYPLMKNSSGGIDILAQEIEKHPSIMEIAARARISERR